MLLEQLQSSLGESYTIEKELGGGGMSRVFLADAIGESGIAEVLPGDVMQARSLLRERLPDSRRLSDVR